MAAKAVAQAETGDCRSHAESDSELFTAFGTTARQHSATILGCHTGAETVNAGAFENTGLEGTFHDFCSKNRRKQLDGLSGQVNQAIPAKRAAILLMSEGLGNEKNSE